MKTLDHFDLIAELHRTEAQVLHTLGKLYMPGEEVSFCEVLEDIVRPANVKVNEWTAIPETGDHHAYTLGIWPSNRFKRECISIYTEADKMTLINGKVSYKHVLIHGGNDHRHTEGCPLVAYNLVNRLAHITYHGTTITITEKVIQGTAEKDLFDRLAPHIRAGKRVGLKVLNLF